MNALITKCPSCRRNLEIAVLRCPDCGLELRNRFAMSPFDLLSEEQKDFLLSFLRNRGNLTNLQNECRLSYTAAKKKLDELLEALGITDEPADRAERETIDVSGMTVDPGSTRASEIIRAKLIGAGGRAMVRLYSGERREIAISPDGKAFLCPQLIPYSFAIFDAIMELLLRSPGHRAKKGNARNFRLGEPGCEESTVAGAVLVYMGKKPGESGLDPVFILAAVLDWAGIAKNGRGELALTAEYLCLRGGASVSAPAAPRQEQTEREDMTMDALAKSFENELIEKTQRARKECGYDPIRFNQMLAQYGGVETARRLISGSIRSGAPSDGFTTLFMAGRTDLSMEASVADPKYASLFSAEQIGQCKKLLGIE